MEYPKIIHLYKYYSYNANALSVLINKRVWFSKPASLNDPFDLSFDFVKHLSSANFNYIVEACKQQPGLSKEELAKLNRAQELEQLNPAPDICDESWEVANKKLREDIKNSGIFCMSEINDNPLMWAHYSDCHKGFCLEFIRSPQNSLGNIEITNPVIYSCDCPCPNPFSDEDREKCFDHLFLTKSIAWSYEREWRLINERGDISLPFPGDLSSVIFGLNMPSQNKETIKNILARDTNICFRQVEKVKNSFELKVVDYAINDSKD